MRASSLAAIILGVLITGISGQSVADPIKLVPIGVTASSTTAGGSPWSAVDGDSNTNWNAGGYPTQWIQLDLGRQVTVRKIRLQVAQSPAGQTTISVSAGASPDPAQMRNVTVFTQVTTDGDWLQFEGDSGTNHLGNIRYIRITTTAGPSWVSWKEIEVYQGMEYFGYWDGGNYYSDMAAAGANIGLVQGGLGSTTTDIINAMSPTVQNNGKVVLHLDYLLFNCGDASFGLCDGSTVYCTNFHPSANSSCQPWQTQLDSLMSQMTSTYQNSVAAFYLEDEPNLSSATVRSNLNTVATHIRGSSWSKPIAVILTQAGALANGAYFSTFDWIGFDCYGHWLTDCHMDTAIPQFRSALSPTQRMIAVPQAFESQNDISLQNLITDPINPWNKELLGDSKYVMVLPFAWTGSGTYPGPKDLVLLRDRLTQLARSLIRPDAPPLYSANQSADKPLYGGYVPFYAFDGDSTTYWTPATYPPYSMQMDFYGSTRITGLQLVAAQAPTGSSTTHLIEGCPASTWPASTDCTNGQNPSAWFTITSYSGPVYDQQVIPFDFAQDVSSIRVRTTSGSNWEGWREIRMFQARPPQHASFNTASPGTFGADAYHVDQYGQLWHLGSSWSLVPSAPSTPMRGGIARLTNTTASNYDGVVLVGNNGHLYQYFTQNGSAYAWSDMGLPTGCDAVIGNPSVATGTSGQLNIAYRCNNNHLGRASKTGLGAWAFSDIGGVPSGAASDPGQGLAGSSIYIVGYDGRVYRCFEGQSPSNCILSDGNNYPYGVTFVGSPGVVNSQTNSTLQWYLVADSAGNMWQFDAYYGWWTNLGQAPCGKVEGDVSAVVDGAHNYWLAAARCAAEDKIAIYTKTGTNWQATDTTSWAGLPLSKPAVATYYTVTYGPVGNVAFQTTAGEQRLTYYYPGRADYGWGTVSP